MVKANPPIAAVRNGWPGGRSVVALNTTPSSTGFERRAGEGLSPAILLPCQERPTTPRPLTDDPELRHTEGGIVRAMFRVAVSGRREQEPSFYTVIMWRNQAEHAAHSLSRGSRVVVVGRLQQRSWTAEDGSARSVVEVVAEELGPSLRWATARPARSGGQ
jgi:single-strand DNA-binding protein